MVKFNIITVVLSVVQLVLSSNDSTNYVGIGSTNPQRQVTIGGDGTVHGNWYTERTFTTTNIPLDALEYVPKSYVDAFRRVSLLKLLYLLQLLLH